jgi:hypothetical protein
VDLDEPEVVQLDRDHARVVDPAVEHETLLEQACRAVVVAGESHRLRLHVQRRLANSISKPHRECACRSSVLTRAGVVAVLECDATEAQVGIEQRLGVVELLR